MLAIAVALALLALGLWLLIRQPWENAQISAPRHETAQLRVGVVAWDADRDCEPWLPKGGYGEAE